MCVCVVEQIGVHVLCVQSYILFLLVSGFTLKSNKSDSLEEFVLPGL